MPFLDHEAAVIDAIDEAGPWAKFRIDDARRCQALLRELRTGDVVLSLGTVRGTAVPVTLWALDDHGSRLHFSADAEGLGRSGPTGAAGLTGPAGPAGPAGPTGPTGLAALTAQPALWAAANLGDLKLQFPVRDLAVAPSPLPHGLGGGARTRLEAAWPSHIYSLPRRRARRLRQGRHRGPQLRFRHPLAPATLLTLATLDISAIGCALWKPASVLPLVPGTLIVGVEVQLDSHALLYSDLLVQHLTRHSSDPDSGARVGCSWQGMPPSGLETLLRWLQASPPARPGGAPGSQSLISLRLDY